MSKLSHASSRRMYSWWWDSHISPQNSRWLVENLTDMDAKVKSMIKLIEQDADSFASRAEMYYEKRPELMKMVEEFYRAYRALAERYDHATGALRQATEAFPKQVPSEITEDELEICANEKSVENFGSLDDENFGEQRVENKFDITVEEGKVQKDLSTVKFDKGIQTLSEVLAKFEAEKEFSLAKYSQSLEKLSHQEKEFLNAQEVSKELLERANKAEDEVESLSKAIRELEFEKERNRLQYQKCLDNIENMEGTISIAQKDVFDLNERAYKAETENLTLKLDLACVESEKATSLDQCKQYSEKILDFENKLMIYEDEAKKLNKKAEEAEREAETYKQAFIEMGLEKEATAVQYQQCLDTVSSLERELNCAQEEVLMLDEKVKMGVDLLKGAKELSLDLEKSNKTLNNELETLKLEMGAQSEELMEKKRKLDTLKTNIEEEKMRFAESETAFQMLQLLQGQTENELNSLTLDLENRSLIISDLETRNQSLVNEALKMTEDMKILNQLNIASSVCMKDMQGEILSLKEAKEKLEEDVELGVDQRSALEQEINCLKEQFNELNKKYYAILDENLNLKETRERESREKEDLLNKLEDLEKVVEKNSLLEKAVSDLNADLEGAREEIIAMVKSIQSLFEEKNILDTEKESLVNRLQVVNENLEKLLEKNAFMENSISNAHREIEELQMKLKGIENEKFDLNNDKVTLVSQMKINGQKFKDIEKKYQELEEKHSVLEKEKESTLCEVQELRLIVKESKLKGDKQMIEIENLHGKVMHMQKISVALQKDNLKLIDEKISLVKDLLDLQGKNNTFEGENLSILCETASLSNLSLIFKNIINEKGLEIKELNGAHKSLEEIITAKDRNIEMLKERISVLEGENEEIQAQLANYVAAISSLRECISSLERSTFVQLRSNSDEKLKAAIENHVEGHEESITDQKGTDKSSELQELEARVKTVEMTVIENNSKLEAATRQIEDNRKPLSVDTELQNGLLAKDIMLDQVSNMNIEETNTTHTKKTVHFGSIIEKELGVDSVAAAKKVSLPDQNADKTMALGKLNSDSLKLGDLQITVQDLKRKAEMSEKMREGKSSGEYDNVKKMLERAEEEIKQLSHLNGKLIKSVDKSDDAKDVAESEENVKFSEQAGTVSEGVGKLELEMQKIQYIMLKLDEGTGKENKSEITKTKRTSIRNYLGLKTSNKANKRAFCGFVHPPTIEE